MMYLIIILLCAFTLVNSEYLIGSLILNNNGYFLSKVYQLHNSTFRLQVLLPKNYPSLSLWAIQGSPINTSYAFRWYSKEDLILYFNNNLKFLTFNVRDVNHCNQDIVPQDDELITKFINNFRLQLDPEKSWVSCTLKLNISQSDLWTFFYLQAHDNLNMDSKHEKIYYNFSIDKDLDDYTRHLSEDEHDRLIVDIILFVIYAIMLGISTFIMHKTKKLNKIHLVLAVQWLILICLTLGRFFGLVQILEVVVSGYRTEQLNFFQCFCNAIGQNLIVLSLIFHSTCFNVLHSNLPRKIFLIIFSFLMVLFIFLNIFLNISIYEYINRIPGYMNYIDHPIGYTKLGLLIFFWIIMIAQHSYAIFYEWKNEFGKNKLLRINMYSFYTVANLWFLSHLLLMIIIASKSAENYFEIGRKDTMIETRGPIIPFWRQSRFIDCWQEGWNLLLLAYFMFICRFDKIDEYFAKMISINSLVEKMKKKILYQVDSSVQVDVEKAKPKKTNNSPRRKPPPTSSDKKRPGKDIDLNLAWKAGDLRNPVKKINTNKK